MKIALVSPYDFTYPGGANEHVAHLAAEYRTWGHDVCILAPAAPGRPQPADPHFHAIGTPVTIRSNGSNARITLSLRLSRQVKQLLAWERPDVIHLHEPLMPALPLTVLYHAEARTVGTFHAFSESNLGYFYARPLLQPFVERLDARIAVSKPAAEFVSRYFGGDYTIIPNGIETARYGAHVAPLPEYRDGRPTILFVGRHDEPRKGFRYLLRAFGLVREQFPAARLLVVGRGDIKRFADDLAGEKSQGVEFVGFVDNDTLPRYYVSCDVFCAPSTKGESFGLILLEAMASARAVVASRIPGYASVISHGEDGWLVPPQDAVGLALALVRLLADRDTRERIALAGWRTAQRYSWAEIARRVFAVYQGQPATAPNLALAEEAMVGAS
ncbi:MAG: glycosyltransferase family 4 protein [Thermomicrobiales bacterium]|jgi:phosphatidylinositol alpha-mannosyltransferase|nr:glycosyltransferase family 4 protein [Thermomicrobiales bacterium]